MMLSKAKKNTARKKTANSLNTQAQPPSRQLDQQPERTINEETLLDFPTEVDHTDNNIDSVANNHPSMLNDTQVIHNAATPNTAASRTSAVFGESIEFDEEAIPIEEQNAAPSPSEINSSNQQSALTKQVTPTTTEDRNDVSDNDSIYSNDSQSKLLPKKTHNKKWLAFPKLSFLSSLRKGSKQISTESAARESRLFGDTVVKEQEAIEIALDAQDSNSISDANINIETTISQEQTICAEPIDLGNNKEQMARWLQNLMRDLKPDAIAKEKASNKTWHFHTNEYNTTKYIHNHYSHKNPNPDTGNHRVIVKVFARADRNGHIKPTYNGPQIQNYLDRLESNYKALIKTIGHYKQEEEIVLANVIKLKIERLYKQVAKKISKHKIDAGLIRRAEADDKNAIKDFKELHAKLLESIRRFNRSCIDLIQETHTHEQKLSIAGKVMGSAHNKTTSVGQKLHFTDQIAKKTEPMLMQILKLAKKIETDHVERDNINPIQTDLIHIFPVIIDKTIDLHTVERQVHWYLNTTIPVGRIHTTNTRVVHKSDELVEDAGVSNFRQHLLCKLNGVAYNSKTEHIDLSGVELVPLSHIIRHASFPAIYEEDKAEKKISHMTLQKRIDRRLVELHKKQFIETDEFKDANNIKINLKIMSFMLMTPYSFLRFKNKANGKDIRLRGNECENTQITYSALAMSNPEPYEFENFSKKFIVSRHSDNSFFELPVNMETTAGIKTIKKLNVDTYFLLNKEVRQYNHEAYRSLEKIYLDKLNNTEAMTNLISADEGDSGNKLSELFENFKGLYNRYSDDLYKTYLQTFHPAQAHTYKPSTNNSKFKSVSTYENKLEQRVEAQATKKYKKYAEIKANVYQKYEQSFTDLKSNFLKLLMDANSTDELSLEQREFVGSIIEFLSVQASLIHISNGNNYTGKKAYEVMNRMFRIANWLGYYTEIFCKSSKDRSGALTMDIESTEIFKDIYGYYPQTETDYTLNARIFSRCAVFYSTSKAIGALNNPGSEGINRSDVRFLTKNTRDLLHYVSKLSKETWTELAFTKPYGTWHQDRTNELAANLCQSINKIIERPILVDKILNQISILNAPNLTDNKLRSARESIYYIHANLLMLIKPQEKDSLTQFDLINNVIKSLVMMQTNNLYGSDSKLVPSNELISTLKKILDYTKKYQEQHKKLSEALITLKPKLNTMKGLSNDAQIKLVEICILLEALNDRYQIVTHLTLDSSSYTMEQVANEFKIINSKYSNKTKIHAEQTQADDIEPSEDEQDHAINPHRPGLGS